MAGNVSALRTHWEQEASKYRCLLNPTQILSNNRCWLDSTQILWKVRLFVTEVNPLPSGLSLKCWFGLKETYNGYTVESVLFLGANFHGLPKFAKICWFVGNEFRDKPVYYKPIIVITLNTVDFTECDLMLWIATLVCWIHITPLWNWWSSTQCFSQYTMHKYSIVMSFKICTFRIKPQNLLLRIKESFHACRRIFISNPHSGLRVRIGK